MKIDLKGHASMFGANAIWGVMSPIAKFVVRQWHNNSVGSNQFAYCRSHDSVLACISVHETGTCWVERYGKTLWSIVTCNYL